MANFKRVWTYATTLFYFILFFLISPPKRLQLVIQYTVNIITNKLMKTNSLRIFSRKVLFSFVPFQQITVPFI